MNLIVKGENQEALDKATDSLCLGLGGGVVYYNSSFWKGFFSKNLEDLSSKVEKLSGCILVVPPNKLPKEGEKLLHCLAIQARRRNLEIITTYLKRGERLDWRKEAMADIILEVNKEGTKMVGEDKATRRRWVVEL